MSSRRKDSKGRVLKSGESQRSDGTYMYRYTDSTGKRLYLYSPTLEELRLKEEEVQRDRLDGVKVESRTMTLNDMFERWSEVKRGLKDNTFQNYSYMYKSFVKGDLGKMRLSQIRHSDVRRFYNSLYEAKNLKVSTIDNIQTILHQIFEMAVQDQYLRFNPSDNALKELKLIYKNKPDTHGALTVGEQRLFFDYLKNHRQYQHWYPIFFVMANTGMRVGEITGLRWCDVNFEKNYISIDHTLVYYNHSKSGCYYNIHTPKTESGVRTIPMVESVKKAFEKEKYYHKVLGVSCKAEIDGFTDFIFINRFGNVQNQATLNKAIKRIVRDCNSEMIDQSNGEPEILLPRFSCHSLRHTFATRLCEAKVNMKVIQDILGHADISTTMNIYTDAKMDLKQSEFKILAEFLKAIEGDNE